MSQHDQTVRMRHMLDHAKEAVAIARGKSENDVVNDRLLQLSLARLVQIIGEAASKVPPSEQEKYPAIPWQDAAAMRHRLVHDYDVINIKILWETINDDLPPLIAALEKIVPPEGGS